MNINGDLILAGNLLPAQKNTYDIGSSELQWRNIYSNRLSINGGNISSYRLGVSGDIHITGYSIFDDYVNIGTSGQNTYKLYVNGKTYLNGQTTVYKDFRILGNESTDDSTHLFFLASDSTTRAKIAFNGNTDNTFNSSTHLKIETLYGDIKLIAASGNLDIGDGNRSLIWRRNNNVESGVYYHTTGRESVVFANVYQHTGWIFVNGIRPSARTQWNALGVTPALQIHHNAIYVNRPVRDADTADYNLYVNGNSNLQGSIIFSGDLTAFYDSADQYLSYTAEGSVSNHAGKLSLYRIAPSGTSKVAGTKILGAQLDAASGLLHLQAAASNPSATAGARIKFTYYNSSSDQGQAVYISSSVNDSYRTPYGIKIWGDVGTAPGAWLEVEGNLYIGSASNANSNNNSALYIRGMSAIEGYDNWLRLNDNSSFTSGTYSPKLIRSDEALQVGSGGANFYANNSGNGYFSNTLGIAGTNTGYKLYVNGTSYFNGDISGAGNIYPIANNSKNLGSSTLKWANVYATTFHGSLDGSADKVDGYHLGEAQWAYSNTYNQPTAGATWYLKIQTSDWNNTSETIYLRGTGNNRSATVILKTGSRQSDWWGYATNYNGVNISGVKKVISSSDDVYIRMDSSCTQVIVKTTFSPRISTSTETSGYTDVPSTGGFFANRITVPTIAGNVTTATNADKLDGYHFSDLEARYVNVTGDTMTGDLVIQHTTSASVAYGATNPTITFKNSDGSQNCSLIYTDYDSVRAPAGIKLIGNQGNEWFEAPRVFGAVWNDYAEYRNADKNIKPGQCVVETGFGNLILSTKRLQPGANIVSDTFGFAIGETKDTKTPLAVSGRVLAYPYEDRKIFAAGDPVCSGPNGTVSKMTREEVREYPDRIVGTVSEIPEYEIWGTGNVKVNGRIWIKVK